MTSEEQKQIYNNILQELATRISQSIVQAHQVANDSIHHNLNKLFQGASLTINAPDAKQEAPKTQDAPAEEVKS